MTSPRRKNIKWRKWCEKNPKRYHDKVREDFMRHYNAVRSAFMKQSEYIITDKNPLIELLNEKANIREHKGELTGVTITSPLAHVPRQRR